MLVPAVLDGAINYIRSGETTFQAEAKTILELGERYPGDAGVLAAMLLNRITLQPGEGIYPARRQPARLPAGVGVGVMANSDNITAGRVDAQHVDVLELLRVLDFTPADDSVILAAGHPRRGGADL